MDKLKELKDMAFALASSIPEYLGKPTMPPIAWVQHGDIVTVVLADGRKVSANIQDINKLMFDQGLINKSVPAVNPKSVKISAGTYPEGANVVRSTIAKEVKPKKSARK